MIRAEKSRLRGKVKGKEQVRDSTNAIFFIKTRVGKFAFSLINKITTRVSRNYDAHSFWEPFFGTLAIKRFFSYGPHR